MTTEIDPILIDIPMPIVTPRLLIRNVLPDGSVTGHAEYVRYNSDGLPDLKVEWG